MTVIAGIFILVGAGFKLEHYPYGNLLLWAGIFSYIACSATAISLLKKRVKELEKKNQHVQ